MLVTFEFDSNGFDIKLRQCIGVGELIVIDIRERSENIKGNLRRWQFGRMSSIYKEI